MPCNPHAATALFPTMSPFMRAGMKCEALGINSATELPALQWSCASEQCTDEQRSQGGHRRCCLGVQLFTCLSPLQPAGLSSPATWTPLVAWHLPAFALETINSVLVPQCTFTHHRNCTINTFSREKVILLPEQQSPALRIIHQVL